LSYIPLLAWLQSSHSLPEGRKMMDNEA